MEILDGRAYNIIDINYNELQLGNGRGKDMDRKEILKRVDHTQLKAYATWEDIVTLCDEAIAFGTASVCVPPAYIKRIHETYGDKINICTVVGFPLGYSVTEAKLAETEKAIEDGANEIDMVINIRKWRRKSAH